MSATNEKVPASAEAKISASAEFNSFKALLQEQHRDGLLSELEMKGILQKALVKMVGELTPLTTNHAPEESTSDFFRTQREEELEPWKRRRRWAQTQLKNIAKRGENPLTMAATLRRQFISEAESGLLTTTEVFLARYTLFTEYEEMRAGLVTLQGILRNMDPDDRLPLHNWLVFKDMEPMERDRYGPVIDSLEVPLFPIWNHLTGERLQALNKRLLSEAVEQRKALGTVSGGAATGVRPGESLFRKNTTLFGGGYQAPLYNAEGEKVATVDLSDLEVFLCDLSRRLDELRQSESAVGAAVVNEVRSCLAKARTSGIRGQRADLRRLRANINRSLPPTRVQESRMGRGGYGGRGGHGSRGYYGGDGEDYADAERPTQYGGEHPSAKN